MKTSLAIAHTFDCGPVRVEVGYTPITDVLHVSGRAPGDPFRDRFELGLTDAGRSGGAPVGFQGPQPLQFFFTVLRKRPDGTLVDVTAPQIDPHHAGRPQPSQLRFAQPGEKLAVPISYFGLSTIVPYDEIVPGDYLVRLRSYDMITVDGTPYPSEPVEMPLTVRTLHP